MRADDHHPPRGRRALLAACGVTLAAVSAAALPLAHAATPSRPVVTRDASGDAVEGGLDLTRAQLGRSSDGRLRAVLTLATDFTPLDLLAKTGPPGSLCVRLWTQDGVKPTDGPATYLACVTGDRSGAGYRASLSQLVAGGEARRVADVTVTRPTKRSITLRFSSGAIGSPRTMIRWGAEATKPGCPRISCIDTAPDEPKFVTLKL